jgi:DNA-binding NarL/FixJ family response regulator
VRILVVEDDAFVNSMIRQILESAGFVVSSVRNVADALISISESEPNVILTDLDLGEGPSGVDLINIVTNQFPWINVIVLSTHRNPVLATYPSSILSKEITYITKSDLTEKQNLISIIKDSMVSRVNSENLGKLNFPILNHQQSEVLQLIAKGYSNQAIADVRGVTLRAAEILVAKVYDVLEIEDDPGVNKRLKAAEVWRSGKVLTV